MGHKALLRAGGVQFGWEETSIRIHNFEKALFKKEEPLNHTGFVV